MCTCVSRRKRRGAQVGTKSTPSCFPSHMRPAAFASTCAFARLCARFAHVRPHAGNSVISRAARRTQPHARPSHQLGHLLKEGVDLELAVVRNLPVMRCANTVSMWARHVRRRRCESGKCKRRELIRECVTALSGFTSLSLVNATASSNVAARFDLVALLVASANLFCSLLCAAYRLASWS